MPPVVKDGKVVVSFKHTGDAPILKQTKFKVPANAPFQTFLYCNSAFAPPPDELVSDVAQCFHVEGVLVLNYCCTPAWG